MEPVATAEPSGTFIFFYLFFVTILPTILAGMSKKSEGPEKLGWLASSLFFSWLGYFAYYHFVVKYRRERRRD